MKKPLFSVASDWHAEQRAWINRLSLEGDSFYALEQLAEHCQSYQTILLAPGDLVDCSRPDSATLAQLRRLIESVPEIIYTQGQHEFSNPPLLSLWGRTQHLHQRSLIRHNLRLWGLDYQRPDLIPEAAQQAPAAAEIILCHQSWKEVLPMGNCSLQVFTGPDLKFILTGDTHQHQHFLLPRPELKTVQVLSPGSTCLQSIDEEPDKRIFVIYDDLTVGSVPLRSRRVQRLRIDSQQDVEDTLCFMDSLVEPQGGVPESISVNILYVSCSLPNVYKTIQQAVRGRAHLFWQDQTLVVPESQEKIAALESSFQELVQEICAGQPQTMNDLRRALHAEQPRQELRVMRREALGEAT